MLLSSLVGLHTQIQIRTRDFSYESTVREGEESYFRLHPGFRRFPPPQYRPLHPCSRVPRVLQALLPAENLGANMGGNTHWNAAFGGVFEAALVELEAKTRFLRHAAAAAFPARHHLLFFYP